MREFARRNDKPEKLAGGEVSRFLAMAARRNYLGAKRPNLQFSAKDVSRNMASRRLSVLGKAGDEVRDWREKSDVDDAVERQGVRHDQGIRRQRLGWR